jgi:hypothetical protein
MPDLPPAEYELWKGSNHYHAMQVATEASVGFQQRNLEHSGIVSVLSQGRQILCTQGQRHGGFEVTHTFGWNPLQQYLIPFPGGRMQCLPIAWDVNARRWYHLYSDQPINPKDWLYWTNAAQNWNGMCATCHSTHSEELQRQTTRTRPPGRTSIVGCEARYGPDQKHVKWAELPTWPGRRSKLRAPGPFPS